MNSDVGTQWSRQWLWLEDLHRSLHSLGLGQQRAALQHSGQDAIEWQDQQSTCRASGSHAWLLGKACVNATKNISCCACLQVLLPLDMRTKKTRAIRKRLTKEQVCEGNTMFYIIAYAGGLAGGSNRRTALAGVRSPHSLSSQHPWLSVKWVSVLAHYGSHAGTAYACALQQFSAGMGQNSVQHHMRCLAAIMRHEYKNELWIRA